MSDSNSNFKFYFSGLPASGSPADPLINGSWYLGVHHLEYGQTLNIQHEGEMASGAALLEREKTTWLAYYADTNSDNPTDGYTHVRIISRADPDVYNPTIYVDLPLSDFSPDADDLNDESWTHTYKFWDHRKGLDEPEDELWFQHFDSEGTLLPDKSPVYYSEHGDSWVGAIRLLSPDMIEYTLNGDAEVTVHVGETYTDPGATAEDVFGNEHSVFADTSNVNTDVPGSYLVVYSVHGRSGVGSRTVIVTEEPEEPEDTGGASADPYVTPMLL